MTIQAKEDINWTVIEADYRAGVKSLRAIAGEHGLTEGGIRKRAKKEDWPRDLSAAIKEKAEALVRKDVVRKEERMRTAITEKEIVESNATMQANKILEHRKDIGKFRRIAMKLSEELEFATDNLEALQQLGELMYSPDKNGVDKLYDLYQKIISLPQRSQTMKALADTVKTLITLEREAFGIADKTDNSINITNTVQTAITGFDLKKLTDEELDFYMALQQKIEVKETNLIEQK